MGVSHAGREHPQTDLSYSVFSLFREQTNTALLRAQVITLNHIIRLNYAAWLKLPGEQRHCDPAGSSQGSEVISQEQLKGQAFGKCSCEHPSLLSSPFPAHTCIQAPFFTGNQPLLPESCQQRPVAKRERGAWEGVPGGSVVKNLPANAGDTEAIPDGRSHMPQSS